jgi:AraC-like DNA-binding protein
LQANWTWQFEVDGFRKKRLKQVKPMRVTFEDIQIEVDNSFGYIDPNPRWSIAPHSHDYFEIHVCTRGRGINQLANGKTLAFQPDVVYLAPPGEVHAQWVDEQAPMELYFMSFQLSGINLSTMRHVYCKIPALGRQTASIYQMERSPSANERFLASLKAVELIWHVISTVRDQRNAQYDGTDNTKSDIVDEALAYIRNRFLENPSVAQIATACHVSPRHLARVFQMTLGVSVHQVLEQERFNWATAQLQHASVTVQALSERMNFSSPAYFGQWFKRHAQQSPTAFRHTLSTL